MLSSHLRLVPRLRISIMPVCPRIPSGSGHGQLCFLPYADCNDVFCSSPEVTTEFSIKFNPGSADQGSQTFVFNGRLHDQKFMCVQSRMNCLL